MRLLWNMLAVIGLAAVIAFGVMFAHVFNATREFDPNAFGLYTEFMGQLLATGDSSRTTMPSIHGVAASRSSSLVP